MEKIEKIQEDVKQAMSEKRYLHSIGSMKKAEELAKIYGENEEEARLVGLVHDIAKEMPTEEILNYVKTNQIEVDEIESKQLGLLHGKIAADIAKRRYGFSNKMQKAIEYHTTGNANMDKLAKILFIADKCEETRNYEDVELVRKLSYQSLDDCLLYILNYTIKHNIEKEKLIHPDSIMTRNQLLLK